MLTRTVNFGQCRLAVNVIYRQRLNDVDHWTRWTSFSSTFTGGSFRTICRLQSSDPATATSPFGPSFPVGTGPSSLHQYKWDYPATIQQQQQQPLLLSADDNDALLLRCRHPATTTTTTTRLLPLAETVRSLSSSRTSLVPSSFTTFLFCEHGKGNCINASADDHTATAVVSVTRAANNSGNRHQKKALHFGAKTTHSQQQQRHNNHNNLMRLEKTNNNPTSFVLPPVTTSPSPVRHRTIVQSSSSSSSYFSKIGFALSSKYSSSSSTILSRNFSLISQSNNNHHHQTITMMNNPNSKPNDSEESSNDSETIVNNDRNHLSKSPASYERKVLRIIVEGNIGSGKTTFLKIFSKNCASLINKPLIVPEPIDLWRSVGGVNIFQLLADDPKRWSFAFQSYVQLTMCRIHEMMPEDGSVKVMERSLFSARYCFVENLLNKGLLQPCEYFVLDEWFKNCSTTAAVDLIIYLRTDPDVVFERIHQRGRPEESGLTLDYLRSLHDLHEDWLMKKKFPLPAPVITIDANIPLEQIMSVYEEKTGGILREHVVLLA